MRIVRSELARDVSSRQTNLGAARRYAEALTPVFPCVPGGKNPLTPRGFKAATTDLGQIAYWWNRWPTANIAVPTGVWPDAITYDVLDVDVRPGGSGYRSLAVLRGLGILRGAVATVSTPSGGLHVYFHGSGQSGGRLRDQFLDFKACGGYVLVPPSRFVGRSYSGSYELLDAKSAGATLDWNMVQYLLRPPRAVPTQRSSRGGGLEDFVTGLHVGERNRGLFWAASQAIRNGQADLTGILEAGLQVGLPESEVRTVLESARRRAGAS